MFPTGIDRRDDLGMPDRFDIYYGMADNRIGAARLDVPAVLPQHETTSNSARSRKRNALQTSAFPAEPGLDETMAAAPPAVESVVTASGATRDIVAAG